MISPSLREGREASPSEFSGGGRFTRKRPFFVTPLPEGSFLAFDPPGGRVKLFSGCPLSYAFLIATVELMLVDDRGHLVDGRRLG